jgi:hypothetical protein
VTSIGNYAFRNSRITSIIIPESVTSIGAWAFKNCALLTYAIFKGNAPSLSGSGVFDNTASDFVIFCDSNMSGWTNPTWNGYPTKYIVSVNAGDSKQNATEISFGQLVIENLPILPLIGDHWYKIKYSSGDLRIISMISNTLKGNIYPETETNSLSNWQMSTPTSLFSYSGYSEWLYIKISNPQLISWSEDYSFKIDRLTGAVVPKYSAFSLGSDLFNIEESAINDLGDNMEKYRLAVDSYNPVNPAEYFVENIWTVQSCKIYRQHTNKRVFAHIEQKHLNM